MKARVRDARQSDAELMELMANGEMEHLGEIYRRYGGAVRSLLWRLLPRESASEADDLCQDVFMTAYQIASRFQLNRELRPWLFGIAARKARSSSRKRWTRARLFRQHVTEASDLFVGTVPAPDESSVSRREINRAMATLPHEQREVLVLYVAHNLSGEQIAESLGLKLNTVWTRLRRARIAMRQSLDSRAEKSKTGEMP